MTMSTIEQRAARAASTPKDGVLYRDASIAALTPAQAAGTAAIVPANPARRALTVVPPADCTLAMASGATRGIPLIAGLPNGFAGPGVPTNALYLRGLAAGVALTILEG